MRNILTIASREYKLYFASPAAYFVTFMVLLVVGILFALNIQSGVNFQYAPEVQIVIYPLGFMMVLITPAITTRLLAEEQRMGTIELLLTAPVRDSELVVGKWLGAFLFLLTIALVSLVYPLILHQITSPGIDQGPLLSGYLGIILLAASLTAIGVAISSLFSNQIAAFAVTLGVLVVIWFLVSPMAQVAGQGSGNADLIQYLDYQGHFTNTLLMGIVDVRDIIYYLSVTALALLLGTLSVESRRWR